MKQTTMIYTKALSFYFIPMLVCALSLCLFYYFKVISSSIFMYANYTCSSLFLTASLIYLQKNIQKKTLLHMIGYGSIIFLISICAVPLLDADVFYSFIKICLCFGIALLVFLRK